MRRRTFWILALIAASGLVPRHFAQEPSKAEIAKQAKLATAFVESGETSKQGSAFCIHERGFFLTNHHVVGAASEVKLILNSGLKNKKVVTARVVRSDKERDLALLKAEGDTRYVALSLGSADDLTELTEVIAVGFPFGSALSVEKGEYPAVSINMGRITSLRTKNGALERIQTDAAVNPGNSGGPVLDLRGKVIGVVVSGVRGSSVNFAIPVNHVRQFVATPEVEVVAPVIAYADRFKPAEFQVRAIALVASKDSYDVELRIGNKGKQRTIKLEFADGAYRTRAELFQATPGFRVILAFEDGKIEGHAKDRAFTIGRRKLLLSDVRTIRFGSDPTVVMADGRISKGAIDGLKDFGIALGVTSVNVDANLANELTVVPSASESRLEYTVVVRHGQREVARVQDFLGLTNTSGNLAGADSADVAQKIEGLWILEKAEENGGSYPIGGEEALLIEGRQITFVKKNGKKSPTLPKAQFNIDPTKQPMTMDLKVNNNTWHAIFRIEGNRLTIGTNCNADKRPSEFTTRLFAGPERSTFLRTYQREVKKE